MLIFICKCKNMQQIERNNRVVRSITSSAKIMCFLYLKNYIERLQQKQLLTDSNIQNLATDITLHMLHILQQYAKGFITGTNSDRWKQHVLADRKYCHVLFFSFVLIFFLLFFDSAFNSRKSSSQLSKMKFFAKYN